MAIVGTSSSSTSTTAVRHRARAACGVLRAARPVPAAVRLPLACHLRVQPTRTLACTLTLTHPPLPARAVFVADHSVEEVYQMIDYYSTQFYARIGEQLHDFDPEEVDRTFDQGLPAKRGKKVAGSGSRVASKSPARKRKTK